MASDDAGDARASPSRVVRLRLRYKSATVDEFIEKYALDVSPRGICVNIAQPLAVGTLVKLEIRLASDQLVIKGVGTVVWHRDREQASSTRPAGLWIKFIQIDEPSKAFIETVTSARADAGLAYEEHEEKEAEDAAVTGSPAPSHEAATSPPVPAAPKLRATLVGITAASTLPARPRVPSLPPIPTPPPSKAASTPAPPVAAAHRLKVTLMGIAAPATSPPRTGVASLPPIPTPPPPKARSLPPPPGGVLAEHGEMDVEDATVVLGEAPDASAQEATLMQVTAPATPPARPRMASLPPIPTAPPPKARPALPLPAVGHEEQSEDDADDVTVIFDHEPPRPEESALPAPVAPAHEVVAPAPPAPPAPRGSAREVSVQTMLTRRRSPSRQDLQRWARTGAWLALSIVATVALGIVVQSTDWFRALTTAAPAPRVAGGAATSHAEPMPSAEPEPAPTRLAVAPVDAAPAEATAPAEVDGATPTTSAWPQAPAPNPTPVTRPISPVPLPIATARPKPKPKPAPTIDDGF